MFEKGGDARERVRYLEDRPRLDENISDRVDGFWALKIDLVEERK